MVLRLLHDICKDRVRKKGPRCRWELELALATFSLSMGKGLADDNAGDRGALVVGVWPRRPFRFPDGRGGAAPRVWPHGSPDERGGGGTGGRGGGTGGRFIGGCVGLDERAREGGHDAGYDVQLRRGAQPRGHPPGMARSIGPDERGGGTCRRPLIRGWCVVMCAASGRGSVAPG